MIAAAVLVTACTSSNVDAVNDAAERKPAASETSAQTGDSVRITSTQLDAPTPSAAFEVTNYEGEVYTYGITFEFLTQATEESQVVATVQRTIPAMKPGQTVKATVTAPEGGGPDPVSEIRIADVTPVPPDTTASPARP
ncbi:hypothetical protein PV682_41260 [Streptomyces niveiscabiei]|uniref:hypothetical protein n=1 Tax=Streptomyces niveiscabiei TaxID=164115 RepID=UPI0029B6AD41|nr:hypothetical protein [Streptomyces niveiscabiei]MDX3387828.1 hypothetical protein [Streptomyces niveiscabiei]